MGGAAIKNYFPIAMFVLSLCAAAEFAVVADWRRVFYWLSTAAIIASVTF